MTMAQMPGVLGAHDHRFEEVVFASHLTGYQGVWQSPMQYGFSKGKERKERKDFVMKKITKALLLTVCILMLTLGLSTFAHAATPNATARFASSQTVKRGKTYKLKFYLTSGSYTAVGRALRARFDTDMYRNITGKRVDYTNYYGFTGNVNYTIRWTFGSGTYAKKAWYKLRYRTQYRTTSTSRNWYTSSSKWIYFYVK